MAAEMEFATFENDSGEGIVGFEPWRTRGPEYEADNSRWYCHLLVNGVRVFEYGCPCGTCGIVFAKVASPLNRVNDREAAELLGDLDTTPPNTVLRRLARVLEPGTYYPIVIEARVRAIEPGGPDDYFANEVVHLFGFEPPEYARPRNPATRFYRMVPDYFLPRTGRLNGPHKAMATSILMPLHDPARLDRARVEAWRRLGATGRRLTALAVSVLDDQEPALAVTCPYEEQFLLTNCILDGHHRVQAAAELGVPLRVLALFSKSYSLARSDSDIALVLRRFMPPFGPPQ